MGTSARIEELRKKFEDNPRRYFAPLANEYRKSGELDLAIAICRQHLADQPTHMSGHIVFGQALYEAAQHEEAQQIFGAALALDPENLIALRHMGDISRALGDPAAAQQWYQRVLDADPRNEEIAGLVREMAAAVSVEGFAGLSEAAGDAAEPADAVEPTVAESVEVPVEAPPPVGFESTVDADAPTLAFVPPTLDAPAEVDVFEPLEIPAVDETAAFAAVPPEPEPVESEAREPEPLVLEAQTPDELAPEPFTPEPFTPESFTPESFTPESFTPASRTPVSTETGPLAAEADVAPAPMESSDLREELEMPSAADILAPPPVVAVEDPLADLPTELADLPDDLGETVDGGAESLLASGRAAPEPESLLGGLFANVGDLPDPEPLLGSRPAGPDRGLDFMENPLGDLLRDGAGTAPAVASAESLLVPDASNALAPEPPLPPPAVPMFEPVDSPDPIFVASRAADEPLPAAQVPAAADGGSTPAPDPFVTESMGDVLVAQGLHAEAAQVYRTLLADRPGDGSLTERLARAEAMAAVQALSARDWLQQIAGRRFMVAALSVASVTSVGVAPMVDALPAAAVAPTIEPPRPTPPTVPAVAPAVPSLAAVGSGGAGPLERLFGAPTNAADEAAAVMLAALYDSPAVIPGQPTTPAADELSLQAVFEPAPAPSAAPAPRTSASFSFDQFFAPTAKPPVAPAGGDVELAEFTRWLDGLKNQ